MSPQELEQAVWLSVSTPSITLALALVLAQVLALHLAQAQAQAQALDQTRGMAAVATLAPMSGTPSQDHRSSRKFSSHLAMLQHCTMLSHCICFGRTLWVTCTCFAYPDSEHGLGMHLFACLSAVQEQHFWQRFDVKPHLALRARDVRTLHGTLLHDTHELLTHGCG